MSIFHTIELVCPACRAPVRFDLVYSVSADRRPDLREAILDGSFQRKPCPSCATSFRVDPEFVYIDLARKQYIGVWPVARRAEWQACAELSRANYDQAFGALASPEAQAIGTGIEPRAVFGWPALVEKLIARGAGIDDRTLEIAKLLALRSLDSAPLPGAQELRLVGLSGVDLVIAWVRTETEERSGPLRVPRALIDEIDAAPADWDAVRAEVVDGLVVDFQREMLVA